MTLSALTGENLTSFPQNTRGRKREYNPFDDEVNDSYDNGLVKRYSADQLVAAGFADVASAVKKLRSSAAYLGKGLRIASDETNLVFQAVDKRQYVPSEK